MMTGMKSLKLGLSAFIFFIPSVVLLPGESFLWEGGPVGVLLAHGFTATHAEVRPTSSREIVFETLYTCDMI